MTQDSDWGVPEYVDDEPDLDFAFRYASNLRDSSYPWGHDAETALHISVKEIERLRAICDKVEIERDEYKRAHQVAADDLELRAREYADLQAEIERLRAENAAMQMHKAENCSNTYERGYQDGIAGNREALEQIKALAAENVELRASASADRSRLVVLEAWASDQSDSLTSLRMRNIFPPREPGAGT